MSDPCLFVGPTDIATKQRSERASRFAALDIARAKAEWELENAAAHLAGAIGFGVTGPALLDGATRVSTALEVLQLLRKELEGMAAEASKTALGGMVDR